MMLRALHAAVFMCGLSALSGCAGQYLYFRPATEHEYSANVVHRTGEFRAKDNLRLFYQSWRPTAGAKAALVIVHGLKDHSTRYEGAALELVKQGIAVHAFDLRGHGHSEGERVYVDHFDQYLDDLDLFLRSVRAGEDRGRPLFLFGHSMGGAIVTLYAIRNHPDVRGVILSGAALKVTKVPALKRGGTHLLAQIAPSAGVFELDLVQFSRDPQVVEACRDDPFVDPGAAPARTASELLGAVSEIQEKMANFNAPLLALHGESDRVTEPQGSRDLVDRASSKDKTLKLYPELVHDLLHEPERAQVLADILGWIDARSAP